MHGLCHWLYSKRKRQHHSKKREQMFVDFRDQLGSRESLGGDITAARYFRAALLPPDSSNANQS
jgi:hypothetical protein